MKDSLTISNYFAGANSWKGFYSLFDNVTTNLTKVYILKGGPGTGKSTLLKKLAETAQNSGLHSEKVYCSSDSYSLDGVTFPSKGLAIIDGTAPHIIDPNYPGAVEEIIDLGQSLDSDFLSNRLSKIKKIQSEIKQLFSLTYNYLHQGRLALERLEKLQTKEALNNGIQCELEQEILSYLVTDQSVDYTSFHGPDFIDQADNKIDNGLTNIRYLFATSLSPQGHINLYPEILKSVNSIVLLRNFNYVSTDKIMKTMIKNLHKMKKRLIIFPCGFAPEQIDCIYLPEHNSACLRTNLYHHLPQELLQEHHKSVKSITLTRDPSVSEHFLKESHTSIQQFESLIHRALEHLSHILNIRSELEQIYIEAQDFTAIDDITEKLEQKIKD